MLLLCYELFVEWVLVGGFGNVWVSLLVIVCLCEVVVSVPFYDLYLLPGML